MLSIGKLGQGQGEYYLDAVAGGIEDYYTGTGEAPGRWTATSAARLGLRGEVDAAHLRAILEGNDPLAAGPLVAPRRGAGPRVPGFDLTFSAPKSVSLAFALGDPAISREVCDAHEAAVDAALGYVERHAAVGRRGRGGMHSVPGEGFIAAAFRHRTSRAGDPQLHTHVLVANVVKGPDGRWTALDARQLYAHAKTAGYLYQSQLRAELTRRLGVRWTRARRGQAEIDGIPPAVLRAFSRRRAELEAQMRERGDTGARAAQIAALDTRHAKDYAVPAHALRDEWAARAKTLGFHAERLPQLTRRAEPRPLDRAAASDVQQGLLGPAGLTERRSTFDRREVVQAWAERLEEGADVEVVERLADGLLADPDAVPLARDTRELTLSDVIRRADGSLVAATADERRYSTAELLARERDILSAADQGRDAQLAVVPPGAVEDMLERRTTLSDEQARMVRTLLTDGAALSVVVGKAGTGKTFALDAARESWQEQGFNVVGAALARRAARELEDGAGIPSTSVTALLDELVRLGSQAVLGHRASVLVVDEAGMVGTRQLHQLLQAAQAAEAKVVLVGDHHQLPEIDAGGVFRGLVHRGHALELTANRRQRHPWERDALDFLREGRAAEALDLYREHDRVVVADDAPTARARLVADWWQAAMNGVDAVMLALRRDDVSDLNERARNLMTVAGRLGDQALTASGRPFTVGDQVVCLRNDRRHGVLNGTRGHVTRIDVERRELALRTTDGHDRLLTSEYLDTPTRRGGPPLDHGYAITGHKAQGMTAGRTFVLGSDALYREWGYVAMSRGRDANRLYLVAGYEHDRDEYAPVSRDRPDRFSSALARSRAQPLAHDADRDPRLAAMPLDELRRLVEPHARDRTAPRSTAQLERELHRVEGTLQQLERRRGAASDDVETSPLTAAQADQARQRRDRLRAELDSASSRSAGASDTVETSGDATAVREELARREAIAVRRALAPPAPYLEAALGPRPEPPAARRTWVRAAADLERYRFRHDVRDRNSLLGRQPDDLRARTDWRDAHRRLDRARAELSRDPSRAAARDLGRGTG